jgi:DNA invertase Pin-like site-specific DNA recombinase
MKRAVIYARVSTANQDTDNQLLSLREAAQRHGWKVVAEYIDHGISGAKGPDRRPQFAELLKAANRRDFDVIMTWSVDRLGRSLQHLVDFLGEIHAKGIDLYLHQQGIDTTTPAGKAMFQMAGVFAEFERSMIQERVKAGLERARNQGKRLGRPPLPAWLRQDIIGYRQQGLSFRKTAEKAGVSLSTVQRVLSENV